MLKILPWELVNGIKDLLWIVGNSIPDERNLETLVIVVDWKEGKAGFANRN